MMSNTLYPRLAGINIRKHGRLYLPYLISSALTIAMFYTLGSMNMNPGMDSLKGAEFVSTMLALGSIVIAIFSLIFLIYTNSFIIKQRTSEFGLYSVLGMEKKHIARVMFFETLYSYLISVTAGLVTGVVFNKLAVMLLTKLLGFETKLGFYVSFLGLGITALLFFAIFFECFIINIVNFYKSQTVNLLNSKRVGEKEPKTKWLMAILGMGFLGAGYAIALTVESPLDALNLFFVAVLCVIFGTYLLFTAGSIAVLKALRKNKSYYYQTKHFNTVSGMLYRMKRNAVGLANICILSTMVLVMISTTVSLYGGREDSLRSRYPSDFRLVLGYAELDQEMNKSFYDIINKTVKEKALTVSKRSDCEYLGVEASEKDGKFYGGIRNMGNMGMREMCLITLDSYNRLTGKSLTLSGNEVAVHSTEDKLPESFTLDNEKLLKVAELEEFPLVGDLFGHIVPVDYVVVSSRSVLERIYKTEQKTEFPCNFNYEMRLDFEGAEEQKQKLAEEIHSKANDLLISKYNSEHSEISFGIDSKQMERVGFNSLYGSFFFLGITLGALFLMVTVMIIYYKQVNEGYDDKERFEIMQKVGMTRGEVKSTIRSQVLTVFFLPLISAFIHLAFSFPIVSKLMVLLNLTNTTVFIVGLVVTSVAFTVIYTVIYAVTSRTYYKIVE